MSGGSFSEEPSPSKPTSAISKPRPNPEDPQSAALTRSQPGPFSGVKTTIPAALGHASENRTSRVPRSTMHAPGCRPHHPFRYSQRSPTGIMGLHHRQDMNRPQPVRTTISVMTTRSTTAVQGTRTEGTAASLDCPGNPRGTTSRAGRPYFDTALRCGAATSARECATNVPNSVCAPAVVPPANFTTARPGAATGANWRTFTPA
jgi:hypothetical protein